MILVGCDSARRVCAREKETSIYAAFYQQQTIQAGNNVPALSKGLASGNQP